MKHLILGTAGHVDHGKTALVKALTGFDCDTHPQEKKRGITINLGFAHLNLPEYKIGIVDVPGHQDFIHNMVAGASGLDLAMLVVAADEGVMPQTKEHLEIMQALKIKKGLVALTKIDLAEKDVALIAEDEVKNLVQGSFLENCPILQVSAQTNEGLDQLKIEIAKLAGQVDLRESGEVFRMFVDRFFNAKGFGPVVNGTVLSGQLKPEDKIFILPANNNQFRVRRLEQDRQEVNQISAGCRASLNLVGLDLKEFRRGQIISDRFLPDTNLVDAKLTLFKNNKQLELWSRVNFHLGTFETEARVHLLDQNELKSGNTAVVQIHLDKSCVIMPGDCFIIRNTSKDLTLGGGEIIDAAPLHHRRRQPQLIATIIKRASGALTEFIAHEVNKRCGPISSLEIADSLNVSSAKIQEVLAELPLDILCFPGQEETILIPKTKAISFEKKLLKTIAAAHRKNPLDPKGKSIPELKGILGLNKRLVEERFLNLLCQKMEQAGQIKLVAHTWALKEHEVKLEKDFEQKIAAVEKMLKAYQMQTPLMSEMLPQAAKLGLDEERFKQVLHYLINQNKVYKIEDNYVHAEIVDTCREKFLQTLAKEKQGLTVAEFRNLIQGNRKISLLLLSQYDQEKVCYRQGDRRLLIK
ncbi:MAG: selenocysteine-specific translation elongation factor [Pseudomonadota bacterium]